MPRDITSTLKERFDNFFLDLKEANEPIPEKLVVPESLVPNEYQGQKSLKYDDQIVQVVVMRGV